MSMLDRLAQPTPGPTPRSAKGSEQQIKGATLSLETLMSNAVVSDCRQFWPQAHFVLVRKFLQIPPKDYFSWAAPHVNCIDRLAPRPPTANGAGGSRPESCRQQKNEAFEFVHPKLGTEFRFLWECLGNVEMDKEQKEVISEIVGEFIAIKYELSLYVDDGLISLGESLENAIDKLNQVIGTSKSEPMPLGIGRELQNHAELTEMADRIDLSTASLNEREEDDKASAKTALPDEVLPRASEVQSAIRHDAAANEIIDLSHWNLEALEAFFFAEHPVPKETEEENEKVADRDGSVVPRILQVDAIHGDELANLRRPERGTGQQRELQPTPEPKPEPKPRRRRKPRKGSELPG